MNLGYESRFIEKVTFDHGFITGFEFHVDNIAEYVLTPGLYSTGSLARLATPAKNRAGPVASTITVIIQPDKVLPFAEGPCRSIFIGSIF